MAGNTSVDHVVSNIVRVVHTWQNSADEEGAVSPDRKIPIFQGADRPLIGEPVRAAYWHGTFVRLGMNATGAPVFESQTVRGCSMLGLTLRSCQC